MSGFGSAKRKSFSDDVADEMGDGPPDDYSVDMGDDEKDGEDGDAQEDRVMAVKELGKAMGDHENPNPRSCKPYDPVEIGLRLIARQRCGHFVQNQEFHVGARGVERNDDGEDEK